MLARPMFKDEHAIIKGDLGGIASGGCGTAKGGSPFGRERLWVGAFEEGAGQ